MRSQKLERFGHGRHTGRGTAKLRHDHIQGLEPQRHGDLRIGVLVDESFHAGLEAFFELLVLLGHGRFVVFRELGCVFSFWLWVRGVDGYFDCLFFIFGCHDEDGLFCYVWLHCWIRSRFGIGLVGYCVGVVELCPTIIDGSSRLSSCRER